MSRLRLQIPEVLPYSTRLRVRVTDLNVGNHVGNNSLLAYLQEARQQFLGQHGMSERDAGGTGLIQLDASLEYRGQVHYPATLEISLGVEEIDRSRFTFAYRMTREGQVVLLARTGMACFDYQTQRPARMPPLLEQALRSLLV